jgi:hypothetical protein
MGKIQYFYATRNDLLTVANRVESEHPIKYVRFGHTTTLPPDSFARIVTIPGLGIASHPSAVGCCKYLVCNVDTVIKPRELKTLTEADVAESIIANKESLKPLIGVNRYAIDQLMNPDTISFAAGGIWKDEILLHGGIGTASQTEVSLSHFKRFQAALRKSFTKVRAFYVGPEALDLLKSGMRLTISAQSPREFDLKE